jgi:hypothetical protein
MAEQLDLLTSSLAVSPVRTLARPAPVPDLPEPEAGCGSKCSESCEKCGAVGFLLRTSLRCELEALTLSSLAWKRAATPAGRSWWVLTMRGRRTGASASGSSESDWPTPTAMPYGSSNNGCPGDGRAEYATKGNPSLETLAMEWQTPTAADHKRQGNFGRGPGNPTLPEQVKWQTPNTMAGGGSSRSGDRRDEIPSLQGQVRAMAWPTPRAEDCEQTGAHRGVPDTLTSAARLWPTATAQDSEASGSRTTGESGAHPGVSLTDAAVHGLTLEDKARRQWVTPTARDWKDTPGQMSCLDTHEHCDLLPRQVFSGLPDQAKSNTHGNTPAPARMLNASWVFQLMGYPATWARLSTVRDSKLLEIP